VKEEAIKDLADAFNWHEHQQPGLGIEFLDEVEECYNRISKNPQQYQSHRDQRVAIMHRFPYKVVYEIENESIVVYAVYHDKRSPEKLTARE
jgi:plasmid stabilization system protein ParE